MRKYESTTQPAKNQQGFSLVELVIAMGVLMIVSLLGYIVMASSTESARVADAQAQLQANLRNVMQQISAEVKAAYSERTINPQNPGELPNTQIPASTVALSVGNSGRSISFQRPVASTTNPVPQPAPLITIALQCEDAGFKDGNATLDAGEDANSDGILTRRMTRTQSATTTPMGAVNDLADVTFTLMASENTNDKNKSTLRVRLVASKLVGIKKRLIKADLEGRIHLEN